MILNYICVLQHAREMESRRREAEEKERKKQREVQMELERQLKEAEMVRKHLTDDKAYLQVLASISLTLISGNSSKKVGIIKFRLNL